ncbi:hypothetical protein ACHAWT_009442 [Skeletonema menzelii]
MHPSIKWYLLQLALVLQSLCFAFNTLPINSSPNRCCLQRPFISCRSIPLLSTTNDNESSTEESDEQLLEEVDISTLQNLCEQYSLSSSGSKQDMLQRLREFANEQAEADQQRRKGRAARVEASLEGKARHTILDEGFVEDVEEEEDANGYFYYAAALTGEEKKKEEEEKRRQKLKLKKQQMAKSSSHLTSPPIPEDIKPNEKGERVVTVYSTTDKNDMTGVTAQTPFADMSMDGAGYQQRSIGTDQPEQSLIGGPFGDTSGSKRKKADADVAEKAKEKIREVVRSLLATTGAPAFQDDYEEGDDMLAANSFSSPYGFTGFESDRIPPETLSSSSASLRVQNGAVLKEVISEFEIDAIGHDGMAADDKSKGGGHYREVEKVGSFLDGFRKAEERRVARETATMLLNRLIKEGVKGLDELLSGMLREGEEPNYGEDSDQIGELNGALVRYLDESIRDQELRAKMQKVEPNPRNEIIEVEDEMEKMWNVTRSADGTTIETIDPNDPSVSKMLQDELRKSEHTDTRRQEEQLRSMTVQEKMLLLLKLLRDRVKVEAVIGNDAHARNLRLLAYCLKAGNDEERQTLIKDVMGNSLDALDIFSDLVTSSIDYAEARNNDDSFTPGDQSKASPMLDISKLQKIKFVVERIKLSQT